MCYSNAPQLNCTLFHASNCAFSNLANLDCALIQWPKIELCLIPMSPNEFVPNSNVAKLNLCPILWSKVLKLIEFRNWADIVQKFWIGVNGFRHDCIWLYWNRAQFNMGLLEYGTIQFYGIGIRHNSICNNGIGHKHYFGLCLIPSTWNELCLIPTYWVSCVPNSIHTIVPYSVGLSSVTLRKNSKILKKLKHSEHLKKSSLKKIKLCLRI